MALFRHIVLATDLTTASEPAHEMATSLVMSCAGRLTVVHVCRAPAFATAGSAMGCADLVGPCSQAAEEALGRLVWTLRAKGVRAEPALRVGVAWERIVEVVREVGADLIVTGTHGRHGIAHLYHGSVAEKVVQESPVPVLAVPSLKAT